MEPTSPWAQGSVHTDPETHVLLLPPLLLLFLRCCHCVCSGAVCAHWRCPFPRLLAQHVPSQELKGDPWCSRQPCVSCGLQALKVDLLGLTGRSPPE